jgi:hypothetical protein
MTFTVTDLIEAFIRVTSDRNEHVAFGLRGTWPHYVKVFGPNADAKKAESAAFAIETYNGAIAVHESLTPHLPGVERRPQGVRIFAHELGASNGAGFGAFGWALAPSFMARSFATADELVLALVDAARSAGRW